MTIFGVIIILIGAVGAYYYVKSVRSEKKPVIPENPDETDTDTKQCYDETLRKNRRNAANANRNRKR